MGAINETIRYWRSIAYEIHHINGGTFDIHDGTENRQYPAVGPHMAADFKRVMMQQYAVKHHGEITKAAVLIEYVFLLQQQEIAAIISDNEKMLADMEAIKKEPITRNEKLYKMARYFYEKQS